MGFKLPGKSIHSGTSAHRSALKMKMESDAAAKMKREAAAKMKKASPAKETDWKAMHEKANKKYNRYKNLTTEEYKKEALRQMDNYKKTGKWDAGGVYDHKGNKIKKDEPKQEIKEDDPLTKEIKDVSDIKKDEIGPKTQKETIKEEKQDVKDARKSGRESVRDARKKKRIKILEEKKDVADAKGRTRRSKRLEKRIERKETGMTRREQRQRDKEQENSSPATMKGIAEGQDPTRDIKKMKRRIKLEKSAKSLKDANRKSRLKKMVPSKEEARGGKAPSKFNAKLKAASAAGKLSGKFKEAVDASPATMIKPRREPDTKTPKKPKRKAIKAKTKGGKTITINPLKLKAEGQNPSKEMDKMKRTEKIKKSSESIKNAARKSKVQKKVGGKRGAKPVMQQS